MLHAVRLHMLTLLVLSMTSWSFSQDFSAEMVNLHPGQSDTSTVKIFVDGAKLRMEPQGKGDKESQIMIWDTGSQKSYVLVPARHVYLEFSNTMMQRAVSFWRPMDVDNACPDWEKFSQQFKAREKPADCHKVGSDTVNGRSAVKYEGTSADGKMGQVWIDVKLRYLVKVINPDGGGMELRNIHEGPSPASLFEIPPGYQKMDMGGMMNRSAPPPH